MPEISLSLLFSILALCIVISAFFSASETAMMAINRYRLQHLADQGDPGALRISRLLQRPDRLIGVILIGNNFANIMASSITAFIALRYFGEAWLAFAAFLLTLVILIFAEVAPKTLAVLHPERIAYPVSHVIAPLLTLLYPAVWVINTIANSLLRPFGILPDKTSLRKLSSDELRTVVAQAGSMIPLRHQKMLLNILDLEKITINDIMVPKNTIAHIDINDDIQDITALLGRTEYTRLPLIDDDIDNIIGIIHIRNILPLLIREELTKEKLTKLAKQPYFVPTGTSLNRQLLNFQNREQHIALIVDEYGDIEGLVALNDILEEIVGEFTTDYTTSIKDVYPQEDGSYIIEGSVNIRALNRMMHWHLSTEGPKTLNGLITQELESIPIANTSIRIGDYTLEIIQVAENAVKTVRISELKNSN